MTTLHEHAVEVDTRIEQSYLAWTKAVGYANSAGTTIMHAAGFRSPQSRHDPSWRTRGGERVTFDDAVAILKAKGDERLLSYGKTGNEILGALIEAQRKADEAEQAYYEANQEYEGWSRFFMVPGGHIHSSMECSTCNHLGHRTVFGWLPELSGLTETEAVTKHGPVLCTVCYPSAPLDWTTGTLNDKGEYVAPKTYCPGSNGTPVEGTVRHNWQGARGRCPECGAYVMYGNNGLRKHQPPKGE